MARSFPRIRADQTLDEAVGILVAEGGRAGTVVDANGGLLGTIGRREILRALSERTGRFYTEGELEFAHLRVEAFDSTALRHVWREFWTTPVSQVMRRQVPTVTADQEVFGAVSPLRADSGDLVVVLEGRVPVGVIGVDQLLAALRPNAEQVRGKPNATAAPTASPV